MPVDPGTGGMTFWQGAKEGLYAATAFPAIGALIDVFSGRALLSGLNTGPKPEKATPCVIDNPEGGPTPTVVDSVRPRRATPRIIDDPCDASAPIVLPTTQLLSYLRSLEKPLPVEPPPPLIGSPANENAEPPTIKARIDKREVEALSETVEDVAAAMTGLAATTPVEVNTQPLLDALAIIQQIKRGLAEIRTVSAGVPTKLQAGGSVGRLGRAAISDYGSETGGGG